MPPRKPKTKAVAAAAAKPEMPSVSRRRSQRVSTSADKKSRYFQAESEGSEAEDVKSAPAPKKRGRPAGSASAKKAPPAKRVKKAVESEEEEADETPFEESQQEEDEEDEEEEEEAKPVKKAARGRKAKAVVHQDTVEKANVGKRRVAKKAADSDAEEEEEDDDSDARPKVVFIPHAKIRDDGGVPYTDERVHPNTLEFLKDLKANNVRSWLKSNDGEFRRALKDWESYATSLTDKIMDLDPTIPELPFKDINFRIYRDIRFTNDPTPYKPHFSAAWSRTGRKGPYACYYVHLEPGAASFIGGGLWHPSAPSLARLRASIDAHPARWRRALSDPGLAGAFFPEAKPGDEEAALAAFAAHNASSALKTKPKGFDAEHRDIGLLKLKSFTVSRRVPDGWWTGEGGQEEVAGVVGAMVGFVTFLNRVVMPDPGEESEESEGEEEDGEDGEEGGEEEGEEEEEDAE
ncbi:hypothetical protein B0T18DRAFT_443755 [Schizothecium vesticola]|uniref:Uncharacterized protein n=1 Tax=Schizothecium vesticola TaxID=314040 RepID=A0AA40F4M9_9PEZI|nr:hypothetical protein B0T18DRAFT_443755 [Schizothecium vesticola]